MSSGETTDGCARVRVERRGTSGLDARCDGLGQIEGRHTPQLAAMLDVLEWGCPVHRAAVVPDDEVTDAPGVSVYELPLCGVLDQVAEEQPAFGHGPVDDARRVRRQIERAAA